MFENFGLIDVFYGFRKYKFLFSAITAVFSFFLIFSLMRTIKKSSENSEANQDDICISSASYYIEPNDEILGISDSNLYRTMPDDYIAVLNADFCKEYILNKLISIYTSQFIIENSGLSQKMDRSQALTINSISELYFAKRASAAMVVDINSMTYSKELSESILNIFHEFLSTNINSVIKNSSIKLSGRAGKAIKSSEISLENIDKSDKRNIVKTPTVNKISIKSIVKNVLIPLFLLVIVFTAFVVGLGLLNPTLNSISDFSKYNVMVIGEIKNYTKIKGKK